jgi:hypothetical protein
LCARFRLTHGELLSNAGRREKAYAKKKENPTAGRASVVGPQSPWRSFGHVAATTSAALNWARVLGSPPLVGEIGLLFLLLVLQFTHTLVCVRMYIHKAEVSYRRWGYHTRELTCLFTVHTQEA